MERITDTNILNALPCEATHSCLIRIKDWDAKRLDIAVCLMGFVSIEGLIGYTEGLMCKVEEYTLWQMQVISQMINERRLQIEFKHNKKR